MASARASSSDGGAPTLLRRAFLGVGRASLSPAPASAALAFSNRMAMVLRWAQYSRSFSCNSSSGSSGGTQVMAATGSAG